MADKAEVVTLPSAALDDAELSDLRRLLDAAFGHRFSDNAWQHALGGSHYVVRLDGRFVAHAAVVERRLSVGSNACTAGYVEAVATDPYLLGRGYASAIMECVADSISETLDLGALATGIGDFYTRFGWERWQGPTFVESPEGRTRTPDDDGWIYVLRTPRTASMDITDSLTCDWRVGHVW